MLLLGQVHIPCLGDTRLGGVDLVGAMAIWGRLYPPSEPFKP